jgi:hypothetical protein
MCFNEHGEGGEEVGGHGRVEIWVGRGCGYEVIEVLGERWVDVGVGKQR